MSNRSNDLMGSFDAIGFLHRRQNASEKKDVDFSNIRRHLRPVFLKVHPDTLHGCPPSIVSTNEQSLAMLNELIDTTERCCNGHSFSGSKARYDFRFYRPTEDGKAIRKSSDKSHQFDGKQLTEFRLSVSVPSHLRRKGAEGGRVQKSRWQAFARETIRKIQVGAGVKSEQLLSAFDSSAKDRRNAGATNTNSSGSSTVFRARRPISFLDVDPDAFEKRIDKILQSELATKATTAMKERERYDGANSRSFHQHPKTNIRRVEQVLDRQISPVRMSDSSSRADARDVSDLRRKLVGVLLDKFDSLTVSEGAVWNNLFVHVCPPRTGVRVRNESGRVILSVSSDTDESDLGHLLEIHSRRLLRRAKKQRKRNQRRGA
eukprot:g1993.t1